MTHKHERLDSDTDTGLPRKLGWKVAGWALGVLQVVALGFLNHIQNSLDDVNTRLARVEGKLNMSASAPVPASIVVVQDDHKRP